MEEIAFLHWVLMTSMTGKFPEGTSCSLVSNEAAMESSLFRLSNDTMFILCVPLVIELHQLVQVVGHQPLGCHLANSTKHWFVRPT
jgi:hypothetical protein